VTQSAVYNQLELPQMQKGNNVHEKCHNDFYAGNSKESIYVLNKTEDLSP
jgi:hypothetical protein